MSDHVSITDADRVRHIRLNRPEKKNALSLAMYTAMADALTGADADPEIRVTLISAAGDAFTSGNDIKDFLETPASGESSPVVQFIRALLGAQKPLVAAVNGLAVGIGTTMMLSCDLAYASEEARFQLPFVHIGLCPEAASSFLLPVLMGQRKASEMLLLGKPFDAREAADWGLVNDVVPAADLEETAMQAARQVAAAPPNAVRVAKRLLKQSMADLVSAACEREVQEFVPLLNGPEAKEALSAFMEKRKPDFSKFR